MQQQTQVQPPKRRQLSRQAKIRIGLLVALVIIVVWTANVLGWIPTIGNIDPTKQASIISLVVTVLGVFFAFVPILSAEPQETYAPPAIPQIPVVVPPIHITNVIPPSANPDSQLAVSPIPPSLPSPDTSHFSGIRSYPPPTDPSTTQQRETVVKDVYGELIAANRSAVVLQGMGGIGKSTLAALVFKYAEQERMAGKGPFTAETVWLTVSQATTFPDMASSILDAIGVSIPDFARMLPQQQVYALINALNKVDKPRLIVLDQFENFLDWNTGRALSTNIGIGELLDGLNSQSSTSRLLLTSRPRPVGTHEHLEASLRIYPVNGLSVAEGVTLLRNQHVQGSDAELEKAVERCQGHGLALKLLITLLNDYGVSLSTFLNNPAYMHDWEQDIAVRLLDTIYMEHLTPLARQVLQAFCVYREAVPAEAAHAVIDSISLDDIRATIRGLLRQNLFHVVIDGNYELHPIVASYARKHFVDNDQAANETALQAAHAKAAEYYEQQATEHCPEYGERRSVKDVQPLIEAVWQYCQAGQWQEAYEVMSEEEMFNDLLLWGGNSLLVEICQQLLKGREAYKSISVASIYFNAANAYRVLGQNNTALKYYEEALRIDREEGDREGEGAALSAISLLYPDVGEYSNALSYGEQALSIHREVGNRYNEGTTLSNLGLIYAALGEQRKALDYFKQALNIEQEVGYRQMEGTTLTNLGAMYDDLGEKRKALEYFEQALSIMHEMGYRDGEGWALWNIGASYFKRSNNGVALACFLLAKRIFQEVGSPKAADVESWIIDMRTEVGERRFARLLAEVEPRAEEVVQEALRVVREGRGGDVGGKEGHK